MIFVTVGTHEQQFNRLIREVDMLKKSGHIKEKVFMQIGYSDYIPQSCEFSKFLGNSEMEAYIRDASIVICHGGPATFISVLESNKVPIVVPRSVVFGEHINNHQVEFTKNALEHGYNLILIENICDLRDAVLNYNNKASNFVSNNLLFNENVGKIVNELLK